MARSKGAAARRRKAAAANKANAGVRATTADVPRKAVAAPRRCPTLPPDVLADIHERLGFLDRIYFASVFDDVHFKPHAPWLLLPGKTAKKFELFSFADRSVARLKPAADSALRGYLVLGSSSRGWVATADDRGQIHLVNPLSGKQRELPHISTMGLFLPSPQYQYFSLLIPDFLKARFGGDPPPYDHEWGPVGHGTFTLPDKQMRESFYRKVVFSTSPRTGSYAAMLIMEPTIGAPAFATTKHPAWRLAPSRDGVEDAIHHDGRFYSVSYSGVVEAWEHDVESGAYTSTTVAPRLVAEEETEVNSSLRCRKYLAAAPGGQLMVVLKYSKTIENQSYPDSWSCSFEVHVLGNEGQWKEATDIGDVALFVGANNSLCLPTTGCPQIEASCVYFTDDELEQAALRNRLSSTYYDSPKSDLRAAGVYSLKDGTVKKLLGEWVHSLYPPPVWIMPSIP